jgi:nucleotide-binding universal stress UspA family protein
VVGVDGSAPSKAALAWAIRQAELTGASVDAVTTWEFPYAYGYPVPVADVDWGDLADQISADAIAGAAPAADSTAQVKVTPKIIEGNAAEVLLEESAGASLLVIGSRGHGGFAEALLGSVGQHCVHHASCPVVIIRSPAADDSRRATHG